MSIIIKNPADFDKMRLAGRLASEVLDYITPFVQAGSPPALDKLCHDYMVDVQGCVPAPAELRAARPQALSQVDLHLGQPSGLPRRPG
jgi:methionine aminopeptidase